MSFATPVLLVLLLAVPALIVWYVGASAAAPATAPRSCCRRSPLGRARASGLAPPPADDRVRDRVGRADRRPGRPQSTRAVPIKSSTIMLVVDNSGSMAATDVAPSRLVAVQRAAQQFLKSVPATSPSA